MSSIEGKTMRFAELNIPSGGYKDYEDESPTPYFIQEIIKGVHSLRADFVSLIDTFRWDSVYDTDQLQTMFGYKHAYCINLNDERLKKLGHNNGITALTNDDNLEFSTVSLGTRDAVRTSFKGDNSLDVFSVYLDDISEETRLEQIQSLLHYVEPGKRTIIMGDFNSIADRDVTKVELTLMRIFRYLPRNIKSHLYSFESKIARRGTIKFLESQGFVDAAGVNPEPTVPTKKNYQLISPFLRLDYAFCTPDIKIASMQVVRGKLFNQVSDHFPFVLEIYK